MGTSNEIVYRHCVPSDFEDFLLQMFHNTYKLLQMLVEPSAQAGGKSTLYLLDDLLVKSKDSIPLSYQEASCSREECVKFFSLKLKKSKEILVG